MSIIKRMKISASDDRGEIIDIFSKEPKDHCTIVTFKKNSIRGNHYHKKSIQSAYVLEGNFKIYNAKVSEDAEIDRNKIEEIDVSEGYYITHEKFEAHTYKCLSDTGKLLVFTTGIRGGENYEDDTIRLKTKLA